jgi:signal transduction histidine kinase
VARELHDDLGQVLTSISLFARDIEQDMTGEMAERTAALHRRVDAAVSRMRFLVWHLRPPELDHLGLIPAVQRLIEETQRELGIPVDMHAALPQQRVPPRVETAVYRIVQEALTNAARHAAVSSISIVMVQEPGALTVIVEDDGRGFDPERFASHRESHMGFIGMRERAEQLGGTLVIDAAPGKGTVVRSRIPFDRPAA